MARFVTAHTPPMGSIGRLYLCPGSCMSRGLGTWQRTIMAATDCAVVVPVGNVVRTSVVAPSRNDFASARRAAKLLAMKSQVAALYAWSCPRCGRVQDRPDPEPCCARPRSMLSVCRPERRHLVRHPAPAPGGSAPRWLSDAHPAPTGLLAPTVDDLARLAAQRLWERLEAGTLAVNIRDLVALMRLAAEFEQDARRPDPRWEATLAELLWLARRHLGSNWEAFAADVRANQQLAAMWGPPRRSGTGPGRFPGPGRSITLAFAQ